MIHSLALPMFEVPVEPVAAPMAFFPGASHVPDVAVIAVIILVALIKKLHDFRQRRLKSPPRSKSRDQMARDQPAPDPPAVSNLCIHLRPFESAMRQAGIAIRDAGSSPIHSHCRIYKPRLIAQFGPLEPVEYAEYFMPERYFEDNPSAMLRCRACGSAIAVLHPHEWQMDVAWFPEPPPALVDVPVRLVPPGSAMAAGATAIATACSPSGRLVAVAFGTDSEPQEVSIWNVAEARVLVTLPTHGVIRDMAWSRDERTLVTGRGIGRTGGSDNPGPSLFVWDTATGENRLRFGAELYGVRGVALSPDGLSLLASGTMGASIDDVSTLDLWDVATGGLAKRLTQVERRPGVALPYFRGVAFSPDGSLAVVACDTHGTQFPIRPDSPPLPSWWGRGVRAFRISTGREEDLYPQASRHVGSVCFSNDGERLFFAGARWGVHEAPKAADIWNQRNDFPAVAIAPDCRVALRGRGYRIDKNGPDMGAGVEVVDGLTGEVISLGRHRTTVRAVCVTPDGKRIIAAGREGELRFWDVPEIVSQAVE